MTGSHLSGGDPTLLRRLNVDTVLRTIRGREPMTLTEISRACGLSRQTIDLVLADLAAQGWVEELAPERGLGRPARRYRFRSDAWHVLGIDVGRATVHLVLADLDGDVVGQDVVDLDRSTDALQAVRTAAEAFVARQGGTPPRAVCLGMPGVIDGEGVVHRSTPFPEWEGSDLRARVSGWFGCPAVVENDANLAAVAEHWRGVAQGVDDFILLLTGRRTGSAITLNGRLHRGHGGAAGEIAGLAILGWDGSDLSDLAGQTDDGTVFADAEAGDPAALARVDRFARIYAQGAAAMVLTVNPDLLVLAGGLSRAGETLAGPTRRYLQELCLDPPEVRASALGVDAVALGAVRVGLDRLDQELFTLPR